MGDRNQGKNGKRKQITRENDKCVPLETVRIKRKRERESARKVVVAVGNDIGRTECYGVAAACQVALTKTPSGFSTSSIIVYDSDLRLACGEPEGAMASCICP